MERIVQVVNMTKKPLNIMAKDGYSLVLPSSGEVLITVQRNEIKLVAKHINSEIKVNNTSFSQVNGLPKPKEGVVYVVPSFIYFQVFLDRDDVYIVDEPVKDGKTIKMARSISRPSYSSIVGLKEDLLKCYSMFKIDQLSDENVLALYELKSRIDMIKTK